MSKINHVAAYRKKPKLNRFKNFWLKLYYRHWWYQWISEKDYE